MYVGLPLDAVSDCNTVNHARAITAGLRALKLLGVDGVELPVWGGIAEKEAMGKYDWSGYLALAEMVQKVGLKLHISLCFHASREPKIPLPEWVSRIGESQPSIFFSDRAGEQYRDCLSLAVDDLPLLEGKTPIQVYNEFCGSFKSSFASFLGSTITVRKSESEIVNIYVILFSFFLFSFKTQKQETKNLKMLIRRTSFWCFLICGLLLEKQSLKSVSENNSLKKFWTVSPKTKTEKKKKGYHPGL